MTNLIIGGNGYIGSALYQKIDADSVDLCLFGKDLGYSKKVNFNSIDISDYKNIILLAGHSSVQMCEYNKENAWKNNVDYFYNLCEKLSNDQVLIYASSGSVYGRKNEICNENDINLNPINHYDLTKVSIDIIANKFILEGKNIIGLRFGTVNGYSQNIRSDLMINSMVYNYMTQGFIKISNEWIKRPILSINDLVNSIVKILENKKVFSGQYNLCSFNSTVEEIANTVSRILNCEIVKMPNSNKAYDFEINNSKFRNIYSFEFKDDISSIITSMVNVNLDLFETRDHDRLFNSCV